MVEFPIFRVSGASPASPIVLCCMHIVKLSGSFYTPAVCFNAPLRLIGVSKVNSPLGPVHFTVKFIISFYVPGNLVLTDSIGKHVMGICNTEVVALPGYTISGMADRITFGKVGVSGVAALLIQVGTNDIPPLSAPLGHQVKPFQAIKAEYKPSSMWCDLSILIVILLCQLSFPAQSTMFSHGTECSKWMKVCGNCVRSAPVLSLIRPISFL